MTRNRVVVAILALVLVGTGVAVLSRMVHRVPVQVRRGASLEVRRQPRLAFERMLAAGAVLPREVPVDGSLRDRNPRASVLFLNEGATVLVRGGDAALLEWVARGGTVVVDPAGGPLSEFLGITYRPFPYLDDEEGSGIRQPVVTMPGTDRNFLIDTTAGFLTATTPTWSAGDGKGGLAIAGFAHGDGTIVVLPQLSRMWTNERIGTFDHAALLWTLARPRADMTSVLFGVEAPPAVTWVDVLWRGWPTVVAVVVLGCVALWRVMPRLSPPLPTPIPARRRLSEHLDAMGQFLLDARRYDVLYDGARRAVESRTGRRVDARTPMTPHDFLEAIADLHARWHRTNRP